ncbi:MAG TPA: biopolymer transporter ExbD [Opitutus sp.]|nr:biopolymer transporter ExbD [Opitutus sp.]
MNTLNDLTFAPACRDRIKISPLFDVIFYLLATFVILMISLHRLTAIGVPVSRAEASGIDTTVYLRASASGAIYWKEGGTGVPRPVHEAELAVRLADYKHRVSQPRVLVRGDDKATYGSAVHLFDEARRAGVRDVSLETLVSHTGG